MPNNTIVLGSEWMISQETIQTIENMPNLIGFAYAKIQEKRKVIWYQESVQSMETWQTNLADLFRDVLARRELLTKQSNNPDGGE